MPVIEDTLVTSRTALSHPALDRPIAFLDRVPVATLLSALAAMPSAPALVSAWTPWMTADRARSIVGWLWRRRIIEPTAMIDESRTRDCVFP
jgi:hypothetical protein